MKLTMVYNPWDCKLDEANYSQTYRDMWLALGQRFEELQTVTDDCSAKDIDGDVIVFFDPHSTHHVKIDGIKGHKAIKYEYMDDPNQFGYSGVHQKTGVHVVKLSPVKRMARILQRAVDYIICPYTENYFRYFGKLLRDAEKRLVWFPPCPDIRRYCPVTKLSEREREVLANGSICHLPKFTGYEFRKWAFGRPEVRYVEHCMDDISTPRGVDYPNLLLKYAGALALCDTHIPPKYIEIPMAGCVCFAQYQEDYKRMGFRDGENCFYVNKDNFSGTIKAFRHDVEQYQPVADAGRKLVEENWTAERFADFIWKHAEKRRAS